ncbi:carboxylesterase family protein [Naasia aerilata]|uniref:Carboxylic ester hydrolase n=1 Tax=Naasia aerilata TaxID=1162966 RepID=A0ABM8G8H9_9MICO|nr:carboxylesterase family protein [Naasia aerilata]BDZ44495.1 carboxylic ester hydrolase [Naasia aerilata]
MLATTMSPAPDSRAEFAASTGRYVGWRDGDVVRVQGIRYATAERFRLPVPVPASADTIPAWTPSPACPQPLAPSDLLMEGLAAEVAYDEDCLRLSITRPADVPAREQLPVIVWIHGGSYVSGGGDLPVYDAAALVREQSVLVVTVTYRLGVLGFLGGADRPANLGLLDQLEALRWIAENIAAFGGDPKRVTVAGESSGADSIAHLLLSPAASGLFARVILQSAPLGLRSGRGRMSRAMARAAGAMDATTPLRLLESAQARAERSALRFGFRGGMPFGPQYGAAPLPAEGDAEAAWRRAAPGLDALIGWTAEETSLFATVSPALRRLFRLPGVRRLRPLTVRLTTDRVYRRDGRRFATLLAEAGARVTEYELDWQPTGSPMGAAHTVDLPLLFPAQRWVGAVSVGTADLRDLVAHGTELRRVWAEFARTGSVPALSPPTSDGAPRLALRRLRR